MIRLDAATVALQWATGGLLFLWVTTRHRLVGLGYGWLLRGVYAAIAGIGLAAASFTEVVWPREIAGAGVVLAALVAFAVSVVRRRAGVAKQRAEAERKRARVDAMRSAATRATVGAATEHEVAAAEAPHPQHASPDGSEPQTASITMRDQFGRASVDEERSFDGAAKEFPPALDLVAPLIGFVGLVAAGWAAGGNHALAIARTLVGALFLGAVSDAMLLGHWYLVQPGLSRRPIHELNDWLLRIWPFELALLLVPTGMVDVVTGRVDDNYNGMLGWFWIACAISTGVLAVVTRAALKERFYSAVMAATGLLYLAILTAFGTDLVARAILAG
jgi:transposase